MKSLVKYLIARRASHPIDLSSFIILLSLEKEPLEQKRTDVTTHTHRIGMQNVCTGMIHSV